VCVCVCVCVYTHTHTHTHIYEFICIYILNRWIYALQQIEKGSQFSQFGVEETRAGGNGRRGRREEELELEEEEEEEDRLLGLLLENVEWDVVLDRVSEMAGVKLEASARKILHWAEEAREREKQASMGDVDTEMREQLILPLTSEDVRVVPVCKRGLVEGYGEIACHLERIKRAVLASEQQAEESSFADLIGPMSLNTDKKREVRACVGEGGARTGAWTGEGGDDQCGGAGGKIGGVQVCEEGQQAVVRQLLARPNDVFVLRALAAIYSCKARLRIPSKEGNNAALCLDNLNKALAYTHGRSLTTAIEIVDAVHIAAWRYEADLRYANSCRYLLRFYQVSFTHILGLF